MPVYDYKCTNPDCGQVTNDTTPVEARDLPRECECGGDMRRLFASPSLQRMIGIGKRRR